VDVWENRMFFGAFVSVYCVRIMNVVWDKRAEGLETRGEAVKIYPLVLFFYSAEINTCFFRGSNNKATEIIRNIFIAMEMYTLGYIEKTKIFSKPLVIL